MTDDEIPSTIPQPSRDKFITTVADSIPIIIAVLFLARLFVLNQADQAEAERMMPEQKDLANRIT
jgi:hypothetical protein|tara:strand:+ start:312 stop:506 length:195 start_codon:yes stop_codon:yes gene_type:complete